MNNIKSNLELLTLLTSVYDIESNVFTYIRNKFQNFLLSINRLFITNNWYNNHLYKYINFLVDKKFFPFIISSLIFIKSKISYFKFKSEEFLNIHIQNKNKLILFLLINTFEALLIKYIDIFFNFCYSIFNNSDDNKEKMKFYSKCTKHLLKSFRNIRNIIIGMNFYKFIAPEENKNIFKGFEIPIKLIGYGFLAKNIYNIFGEIKNIYKIHILTDEKDKNENKNINNDEDNKKINIKDEENDDKENICLLCLNKYKNTSCTPCGHLFCWSCIHLYLTEKNNCPKCKRKIKPQEILFLRNYYI